MFGRIKNYESITRGQNIPKPTIPESFKVLLKELQALCLDITVLDAKGNEVPMLENLYDPREEMRKFMEGNDRNYVKESELKDMGFSTQKFNKSGELEYEEGGSDNE